MRVVIIGANGGLGRCLTEQALGKGFEVTAVVRRLTSLKLRNNRLDVRQGDITDQTSLEAILPGHDVVLAAAGPTWKFRQKSRLLSVGATQLSAAMANTAVKRLIWVTSAGVDPDYVKAKPFYYGYLIKPLFLAHFYEDFAVSEGILSRTSLDWVIIRPSRLTNGPHTGRYRFEVDGTLKQADQISRADVADLMLEEATSASHSRTILMQAY